MDFMKVVIAILLGAVRYGLVCAAMMSAYFIRLYAVDNFGRVIHEFDPWFNYRATEYLAEHGSNKFFQWFDHTVWYPLGRPVGSTIYPGMQFAAVWIWQALNYLGISMSLNDVCVFVPAWFGVVATVFVGLLTLEGTGSVDSAVGAACIMSILPAHIMRSVAGGYDNECVAISALCATFYFWCRSLRFPSSWPWGIVTGMAYFCMVAAWGGYVYVLNMIGVHTALLVLMGRNCRKLHRAYTLFYVIGTGMAIRIPVVGLTPLRSLEQIGPLGIFLLLQVLEFCEVVRQRRRMPEKEFTAFRYKVFAVCGAVGAVAAAMLFQMGYFGPISARVRGLFVQHTRTGNPLVDSVAEHQATSPRAYWQYLYYMCYLGPIGFVMMIVKRPSDAQLFLVLYAGITYYFSAKMNRLVLLLAPIASVLGGFAVANIIHWSIKQLMDMLAVDVEGETQPVAHGKGAEAKSAAPAKKKKAVEKSAFEEIFEPMSEVYQEAVFARRAAAVLFLLGVVYFGREFYLYCDRMAEAMSQPSIIFKSRLSDGNEVIIDDYRESYWWLRDNTPEDSRVMAWWDYGYQINGVANRTTIADGNTWNHEHIATLGRCLTNPEKKAHNIIRHLADYVLIWTGGGGDDLAKSPHMARIANSVYSDVCPGDPSCSQYGVDNQGNPTPMMAESLLWRLHGHNQRRGVNVNPRLFEEAYTSKYNLVRIFKVLNISEESKAWSSDPANWKCDAPGSWYCEGQYPPALSKLIDTRKAFEQLEDFNAKSKADQDAEEYQKAYHARMTARRE